MSAGPRDPRLNFTAGCPLLLTGWSIPRAGGQDAELKQGMSQRAGWCCTGSPYAHHPCSLVLHAWSSGAVRAATGLGPPLPTMDSTPPTHGWPPLQANEAAVLQLWLPAQQAAGSAKAPRLQNITYIMVPGPLLPPAWPDLPLHRFFPLMCLEDCECIFSSL